MKPAKRVELVIPAPLVDLSKKIAIVKKKHADLIDLSQGVSSIELTEDVLVRIQEEMRNRNRIIDRYSSDQGLPILRKEIARYLKKGDVSSQNVLITAGANQAIFCALITILEPGEEVLLPSPTYFNNGMAIRMIGGKPVEVPLRMLNEQLDLDPQALRDSISPLTRGIILINPNNPTGSVFSRSAMEESIQLAIDNDLWILVDETYREFTYEESPSNKSSINVEFPPDRTLRVGSFSKVFGLAGWRIGFLTAPKDLFPHLLKVQDSTTICAPVISQVAATAALQSHEMRKEISRKRTELKLSRDALWNELIKTELVVPKCSGAYYFFPGWNEDKPSSSSNKISREILEQKHVAVVPGGVFGEAGERSFRISFGSIDPDTAREAGVRIRAFFENRIQ